MPEVGHVVVVGGGAAGCATAYYLSAAGARVTIVEREGVGSQASGWSAGGLNPLQGIPEPIAALALESYRLHLDLWPELERLTGRGPDARIISMAHAASDEAAIPALQELQRAFGMTEGFSAEWLDPAAFHALEPRIAAEVAGAVLTRGNGVLDSYLFTALLAEAAQRLGATLAEGTVTGIQHADRRVSGVVLEDRVIPCDAVVVAMGPWSQAAEGWLGVPLPIEPLKGEILRMALAGPPLACDVVTPDVSLFSRGEGQVWLASTHELRGFDKEPSESAYRTLYDPAVHLMPSLAEATLIRQTVCLRPLSPDDLPILGAVPGWDGAYVATGGGMKGILLAPSMGKALADLLLAGRTDLSIEACGPARFAAVKG
jgi:glycine/D-amino acid oxidase-like deaminating enzyme